MDQWWVGVVTGFLKVLWAQEGGAAQKYNHQGSKGCACHCERFVQSCVSDPAWRPQLPAMSTQDAKVQSAWRLHSSACRPHPSAVFVTSTMAKPETSVISCIVQKYNPKVSFHRSGSRMTCPIIGLESSRPTQPCNVKIVLLEIRQAIPIDVVQLINQARR